MNLKEALAKLESMGDGLFAALMAGVGGGQHVLEAATVRLLNAA